MAMTKPTSEQVTFLQTGTGATAQTVDAKLEVQESIEKIKSPVSTSVAM